MPLAVIAASSATDILPYLGPFDLLGGGQRALRAHEAWRGNVQVHRPLDRPILPRIAATLDADVLAYDALVDNGKTAKALLSLDAD